MESIYQIIFIGVIFIGIFVYIDYKKYNKSNYKKETNKNYFQMIFDKGNEGEYRTSRRIKELEGYSKTIHNAYIPKQGKEETSEIDIIIVHEKGIFVIENKNYSGWIFGSEKDRNWKETFKTGKKVSFYNPIKQNKAHIKHLKIYLEKYKEIPFLSVIVFNADATLKNVKVESTDVIVAYSLNYIKRLNEKIKNLTPVLNREEIEDIYNTLKEKTIVTEAEKSIHIENINTKYK
ncbi:nuclease-related domain-containing protein [Lachnospiraceae bacterium 54-53]